MSIRPQCSVEEAVACLLQTVKPVSGSETVPLLSAMGRVLAEDLLAQVDVPPFDRSPLDGYAVRQADLNDASADHPVFLAVTQRICAGQMPDRPVLPGEAVRIMTGAPIPPGADCVVRQEDTDLGEKTVAIRTGRLCRSNIIRKASDTAQGSILLTAGTTLDWTHLPMLASQGYAVVSVLRKPRIAVITTGDELVQPGAAMLPAGKIYNSNSALITGRLCSLGADIVDVGIGPDNPETLAALIRSFRADCDLIITSGGVSVGQRDCMPLVLDILNGKLIFHGVAAKPGTPTMAFVTDVPVLCLSGNPFAAGVMLELLGRPMVERLRGSNRTVAPVSAELQGAFSKTAPIRRFVRGVLTGGTVEIPASGHESGSVAALAGCNCLLDIPANHGPLQSGDRVQVLPML